LLQQTDVAFLDIVRKTLAKLFTRTRRATDRGQHGEAAGVAAQAVTLKRGLFATRGGSNQQIIGIKYQLQIIGIIKADPP